MLYRRRSPDPKRVRGGWQAVGLVRSSDAQCDLRCGSELDRDGSRGSGVCRRCAGSPSRGPEYGPGPVSQHGCDSDQKHHSACASVRFSASPCPLHLLFWFSPHSFILTHMFVHCSRLLGLPRHHSLYVTASFIVFGSSLCAQPGPCPPQVDLAESLVLCRCGAVLGSASGSDFGLS
jgi:hypothetical protein